jgi:hypothetical protein
VLATDDSTKEVSQPTVVTATNADISYLRIEESVKVDWCQTLPWITCTTTCEMPNDVGL